MSFMPSKKCCLAFVLFFLALGLFAGERNVIFSAHMTEDKNLTKDNIMVLFREKSLAYLQNASEYLCDYTVYLDKDKQNHAWALAVVQDHFDNGDIYEVWFSFSNGVFVLKTGNSSFTSEPLGADAGDNEKFESAPINADTIAHISKDLESCMDLSCEAHVQSGLPLDNEEDLPMDCYKFE